MNEPNIQKYLSNAPETLEKLIEIDPSLHKEILTSDGFPINQQTYSFWCERIQHEFPNHQALYDYVAKYNTQDSLTFYIGLKLNLNNIDHLILGINLRCYHALQRSFLDPDFVARNVEDTDAFVLALECATKMRELCRPIGDIYLSQVYARQANFIKSRTPGLAKKFCVQALEALRGFYLHHQHEITPQLRAYDNTLNANIDIMRETLLHAGFFTSEEITQINRDWGLEKDNAHPSTSRSKITI